MKILVRKCPWTGELYEDDNEYRQYLSELRVHRQERRMMLRRAEAGDAAIQWATQNVTSAEQFEKWFTNNWKELVIRGTVYDLLSWGKNFDHIDVNNIPELVSVRMTATFSHQLSNTHSCPKNGVTNWHGDKDKPRGYPGWRCRLEWRMAHDPKKFRAGGDIFRNSVINTGTGSGGDYCTYDVSLWADDWPAWSKELCWQTLNA
jgi:hypothetical protein